MCGGGGSGSDMDVSFEQSTGVYLISCEFLHWPQLAAAATTTHTLL